MGGGCPVCLPECVLSLKDPSTSQTSSEERLNHETLELEKRLSLLSHRSSTGRTSALTSARNQDAHAKANVCPPHQRHTARLLEETTTAYQALLILQTPANQTAAWAAGSPFGPSPHRTSPKTPAARAPRRRRKTHHRKARRSFFPPPKEAGAGLPPSPPGSFRRSAARARQTAASPPAVIPLILEVFPHTQAAWTVTLGRTLGLFSACPLTWVKTWALAHA